MEVVGIGKCRYTKGGSIEEVEVVLKYAFSAQFAGTESAAEAQTTQGISSGLTMSLHAQISGSLLHRQRITALGFDC